jgi:hypothetical protein
MNFQGRTDSPLILHCHIPKTAGTTVSAGLRKSFDLFHFDHIHSDPLYILNRETLDDALEFNPGLRSISSHHLRSFPLSVADRPTFLMTFLRRPEDTLISQLKYAQREFSTFPPEAKRFLPKNTPRLPLRELAREFLDVATAYQDYSPQTRFLCNSKSMASLGLSDGNEFGLDSYEIARSILNDFHFVGVVEEMKKSLEVLANQLLQWGVKVYFDLNLRLNSSPSSSQPEWLTPEDEVGRLVLETSKSDRLLQDEFRKQVLELHCELRKRRWLGFKPAAADAKDAFIHNWRHGTQSLVHSAHLYLSRRHDHNGQSATPALCSDLLELRAAKAVTSRMHFHSHSANSLNGSDQRR